MRRAKMLTLVLIIVLMSLGTNIASAKKAHKNPTWATLNQRADKEIRNGGVYSRRWGAASPKLKKIVTQMIYMKFGHGEKGKKAWCYANRESGLNPWALSATGDHNTFQINYVAHRNSFDFNKLDKPEVGYGINAGYSLSQGGTDFSPWAGGTYPCPQGNEP